MYKRIKRAFLCAMLFFAISGASVEAASLMPLVDENLGTQDLIESAMVPLENGYQRVFYLDGSIHIEDYNTSFSISARKSIPKELDIYGGFFAGNDANYLVFGANNEAENTSAEVIRVVKYSKSWQRIGAASITGNDKFAHEVRYPFWSGTMSMIECNGTLYIATGHQGYVDPAAGMGHQGFLMLTVDEATMTGKIADADLWHSFSQQMAVKDSGHMYVQENSEGSRAAMVSNITAENERGTMFSVLDYGGRKDSMWAIPTYATADGIQLSQNNVLTIGTSIDQTKYGSNVPYNIYLTVTPMNSFTKENTVFRWITANGTTSGYRGVRLVKITDNRFLLCWESAATEASLATTEMDSLSEHVLHYLFLNGNGEVVSQEFKVPAPISGCAPVLRGSNLVYYASSAGNLGFYTINASTGAFTKKILQLTGANATWKYDKETLTISGTGKVTGFTDYGYDSTLKNKVKKIVIKKGITEIGEAAFVGFKNLETVTIEEGLQKIGNRAFYGNTKLKTIRIPASVKKIGSSVFEIGWYSGSSQKPMFLVVIQCPKDSYAEKYAKKNEIQYKTISTENKADFTVKLVAKSYNYTGKQIKPKITVKNSKGTKIAAGNYKVTYKNNIEIGTATLVVTGKGSYKGTVSKKFQITVSKGAKYTVNAMKYKVINTKTVALVGCTKSKAKALRTLNIEKSVKIGGASFKIVEVGTKAFEGCKKLTSVTIGTAVKKLDSKAFYRCSKLKEITIQSSVLNTVGSQAVGGINKKAVIRVPAKKQSDYKKLFKRSKGFQKTIKIKQYVQ